MAGYDSMYRRLFNAVTDAIKLLQGAQAETEEMYISQKDPVITLLKPGDGDDADE